MTQEEQRKAWDKMLTDIEYRQQQLRQIKSYEPIRLVMTGITTGAAVFGSGAAFLGLILHWMGKL